MAYIQKEKYTGKFKGKKEVRFNREWSNYRFTDEECEALLRGEEILIKAVSNSTGEIFSVFGKLAENEYKGNKFYGFTPNFNKKAIPEIYLSHEFSDDEKKKLYAGTIIHVDKLKSKVGSEFSAGIKYTEEKGLQLIFDDDE